MDTTIPPQTQYLTLGDGNMSFSYNLSTKLRTAALHHRAIEYQVLAKQREQEQQQEKETQITIPSPQQQDKVDLLSDSILTTTPLPLPPPLGFFLTATSFDTREELKKYPGVNHYISTIQKSHGQNGLYLGGINAALIENTISRSIKGLDINQVDEKKTNDEPVVEATVLSLVPSSLSSSISTSSSPPTNDKKYDIVYFNNPHVGTEDLFKHIALLSHFFSSVDDVLESNGQVIVTLCDDQPNRWQLLQCAYHCKFICIAAIELNSTEWPYFQHKRHQNDTAFPFNRMIQYYFVRRNDLFDNNNNNNNNTTNTLTTHHCHQLNQMDFVTLYNVLSNEFNTVMKSQKVGNDDKSTNNEKSITTTTTLPSHFYRCDLSIWSQIATLSTSLLLNTTFSPSSNEIKTTETTQLEPSSLEQKATNVGNWFSTDHSYIPLLPILQPQYAFYPLLRDGEPELTIFNPILSLKHIIEAYRLQFTHLINPVEYHNYLTRWSTSISSLQNTTTIQSSLGEDGNGNVIEQEEKQEEEEEEEKMNKNKQSKQSKSQASLNNSPKIDHIPKKQRVPTITTTQMNDNLEMEVSLGDSQQPTQTQATQTPNTNNRNNNNNNNEELIQRYQNFLSQLPQNTELPPSLDSKRLGRPLTQRELVKLERFVQRSIPKKKDNDKTNEKTAQSTTPTETSNDNNATITTTDVPCELCNPIRYFKSTGDLEKHIKIKHNDKFSPSLLLPNQPTQFDITRIPVYSTGLSELDHDYTKKKEEGIQNGSFCNICSILFTSENEYKKHIEFLSPQQGGFKCQSCSRVFNNERALVQHTTLKHG